MTFKHEKFSDSTVMRSLERVAREKGWVETKPIVKSASNKLNLSPSSNLMDNVMRLCSGLRQAGAEKYAADIEDKFVAFKQAATLYDTHGETGEDLVDTAHPDGSHKMEGLDNAIFKTIVDRHLDFVKMVDKKPTGKLSNANDILNAVKIALGDSFLNDGRANITRKTAQERAAETSGVGADIAGTAGVMGGLALLRYVYKKLKAAKALDAKQIAFVEKQLARKLTDAEADVIRKQVVSRVSENAMKNTFGESLAKEVVKDTPKVLSKAIPELGKAGLGATERAAAQTASKGVGQIASKAPTSGLWGRLLNLVGKGAKVPGAAGAGEAGVVGAGEAGAVGAGEAGAATAVGGAAVGTVAAVAAVAASAIIGGIIGYKAFDYVFYAQDILDAGKNLSNDLDSVEKLLSGQSAEYSRNFKAALQRISVTAPQIQKITKTSDAAQSLNLLKQYSDDVLAASDAAAKLMYFAREQFSEYDPRQMLPGFLSNTAAFRNIEIQSGNFISVAAKANSAINQMLSDIHSEIDKMPQSPQEKAKQRDISISPDAQKVLQGFSNAVQKIEGFKSKVNMLELSNKAALNKFLDQAEKFANQYKVKFEAGAAKSDKQVLDFYNTKLSTLNRNLDVFETHLKESK